MRQLVMTAFACLTSACGFESVEPTDDDNVATDVEEIIGGGVGGLDCVLGLLIRAPDAADGALCTCTVVAPHTCLTAAHCVHPRVIGTGRVFEFLSGNEGSRTGIIGSSTAFNPRWNLANPFGGQDLGVVRTTSPLPFPICAHGSVDRGLPVTLIGYGSNTHDDTGGGIRRSVEVPIMTMTDSLIQVGNSDAQTCNGDSGGPAFQVQNGIPFVVGVASFSMDRPPRVCFGGGFHSRVDSARDWLDQNVSSCEDGACQPGAGATARSCPFDCADER